MLLPTASRKSWIYQALTFVASLEQKLILPRTLTKDDMTFWMVTLYYKLPFSQVWCPQDLWSWIYLTFLFVINLQTGLKIML